MLLLWEHSKNGPCLWYFTLFIALAKRSNQCCETRKGIYRNISGKKKSKEIKSQRTCGHTLDGRAISSNVRTICTLSPRLFALSALHQYFLSKKGKTITLLHFLCMQTTIAKEVFCSHQRPTYAIWQLTCRGHMLSISHVLSCLIWLKIERHGYYYSIQLERNLDPPSWVC